MSPKVFTMRWAGHDALRGQLVVLGRILNYIRAFEDGVQVLIMDEALGPATGSENGKRAEGYRRVFQNFLDSMAKNEKFSVVAKELPGGFIRVDITQKDLDNE